MLKHTNVYYAAYDVSDNDVREAIIRILKDSGLVRIQKSVFCGKLQGQLKKDVLEKIRVLVREPDSFFLIMNCSSCFEKFVSIGASPNFTYVDDSNEGLVF